VIDRRLAGIQAGTSPPAATASRADTSAEDILARVRAAVAVLPPGAGPSRGKAPTVRRPETAVPPMLTDPCSPLGAHRKMRQYETRREPASVAMILPTCRSAGFTALPN